MPALPSVPFVSIDSARVAVDAPVSTDLMTDIAVDLNYLKSGVDLVGGKSFVMFTTPGANTWTVPAGITTAEVEMVGGGGGGGGAATGTGGGGGSAAYQRYQFTGLTPGASVSIQVGAGGAAVGDETVGNPGTDSWFSNTGFKAAHGLGGLVTTTGGAAGAATNSGTVIGISGEAGGDGSSIGGTGGRAPWLKTLAAGLDNAAGSTGGNPVAGYLYGGGGGGGFGGPGTRGGAAGAQGYVLIRY